MSLKILAIVSIAALAAGGWVYLKTDAPTPEPVPEGQSMVVVTMPTLTGDAKIGERVFVAKCATCHGPDAGGVQGKGPPLIHKIYEPGHHGDIAFERAAKLGVRAHHWPFGNMPPVEGVTGADVKAIIAYIRVVQQENGIF